MVMEMRSITRKQNIESAKKLAAHHREVWVALCPTGLRATRCSLILLFLLICLLLAQNACFAANYYVDAANGNDNNNGLSIGAAWKTIEKVNNQTFNPGDSILFKRGETWREQLIVPSSGDSNQPITFGAYGEGEDPEINGSDIITGWSRYQGNIYVADVSSEVTQLFADGERQVPARWPNRGWQNIDDTTGNDSSLYSESLTQQDNHWVGATIVVKTYRWYIEERRVIANSGNTITWDGNTNYPPKKNYGFYLEGKLEEIDTPGEWCYSEGKVYFYVAAGGHPDDHLIEGSVRGNGIRFSGKQHIHIENTVIGRTSEDGVYIYGCDYINMKDNVFLFTGRDGIRVTGPLLSHGHIYIRGNIFRHTRNHGIRKWGQNYGEITDNELTDIATFEISPRSGSAISDTSGANVIISGNRIDGVCYHGIVVTSENSTVSHNVISDCLLLLDDGGAIYTWGSSSKNISIRYNILSYNSGNVEGTPHSEPDASCGIYLDDHSAGITVERNVIFGCRRGINLHNCYDSVVSNNTLYDNDIGLRAREDYQESYMHDNKSYNNILLCADVGQITLSERSFFNPANPVKEYDYNLHYNPYRQDVIGYQRPGIDQFYTLNEWRAFSGHDANSIGEDPLFIDPSNADFHLQPLSPCIEPNIGAYEYGSSVVPPLDFILGDVTKNGEISSYDASLAAQYSINLINLSPEAVQAADVTGNNEVSSYDASLIAQYAIGLIESF